MDCLQLGRKCHSQTLKNGIDRVLSVQNFLIHMYWCCGDVGVGSTSMLCDGVVATRVGESRRRGCECDCVKE
ncbi:hypothetical protein HN51_033889 [Arachis hypogaea]